MSGSVDVRLNFVYFLFNRDQQGESLARRQGVSVYVREEAGSTSGSRTRWVGACCYCAGLGKEGNRLGSHYCFSLHRKQLISGSHALCQSYSLVTKQLYQVETDIQLSDFLCQWYKIGGFPESRVFSSE